jgi:DeoR-like helix-turn-helix domain
MSLRLERLLAMDAVIRAECYPNVAAFIERFEVSERTVRRDLAFMRQQLNAPLAHDRAWRDDSPSRSMKIASNVLLLLRYLQHPTSKLASSDWWLVWRSCDVWQQAG